ncbi:hypothetical protein C2S53_015026 [Perilla frutescens var. hirtella]|uniref:NB-ARC domain-containing protein n=1 Tax=Perilla frutescens var. hirtella TaxID=608512 RepID=A0AAD4P7E5_PERFH|nr:hypothetical protein C2S53_015026 [Perilla frutescens var. hirtella]
MEEQIRAVVRKPRSVLKSLDLASEVKFVRENRVLPVYNYVKDKLPQLEINGGSRGVDDSQTKLRRDKPIRENRIVGFEDEEAKITEYLMQEEKGLDVIPIIGIPGQGKTTLTWKIYENENICFHFPIRIWVYISQKFNSRDVFLQILKKFTPSQDTSKLEYDELVKTVRACLEKEKFLLVLDDVWSVDAWEEIKEILPLGNRKSKVLITSREVKVGNRSTTIRKEPHKLRFLTEPESWTLLEYEVFGDDKDYPKEFNGMGKHIANKCDGVPLTLVVIGGILRDQLTSISTDVAITEWEMVSENVSRALESVQRIKDVVALSYDRLPEDLRDCFIYMGVFPEDYEIPVKMLLGLWIAEGFVQAKDDKSSEQMAELNLNDLISMNLVKVEKTNHMGKVKTCRVHDMIRAFCITKSKEQKMFREIKESKTTGALEPPVSEVSKLHRLCFQSDLSKFLSESPNGPHVRSLLCFYEQPVKLEPQYITVIPDGFKKLRILESKSIISNEFPAKVTTLMHLRYLTLCVENLKALPKQIAQLWNLQTLVVDTKSHSITMEANIWRMIWLRHVQTKATIVLNNEWIGEAGQNLQTLGRLSPESCTEDVSRRAKNLKTLTISGKLANIFDTKFLAKLHRLEKLKLVSSLAYERKSEDLLIRLPQSNCFPPYLKRLTLVNTFLDWPEISMLAMIRTLEVLKLKDNAFTGVNCNVSSYVFPKLQFLLIVNADLVIWDASANSFPSLKFLVVKNCENLIEIPECLGTHLQKLEIERLRESAVESARNIGKTRSGKPESKFSVPFNLNIGPACDPKGSNAK